MGRDAPSARGRSGSSAGGGWRSPCDLERIASHAVTQVCDADGPPTMRLLCGPIPWSLEPWQRKGCVYAVATTSGCVY